MSLTRTRFYYCGTEDVHFDFYDGFIIDFPSACSQLDAQISTAQNLDGTGAAVIQKTLPERHIPISGYIIGSPTNNYRRLLDRCFAPLSSGRLWAETEDRELFFLDCISAGAPVIEGVKKAPRFQVSLLAEYPYWQRDIQQTYVASMTGNSADLPIHLETDVDVLFGVEITSSDGCRDVLISVDGKELAYDGSVAANQVLSVRIDKFGRISAFLDGINVIGNIRGSLKTLPAGQKTLHMEASENNGTLTATFSYREARAGV